MLIHLESFAIGSYIRKEKYAFPGSVELSMWPTGSILGMLRFKRTLTSSYTQLTDEQKHFLNKRYTM